MPPYRPAPVRYAVAVAVTGLAVAARLALIPLWGAGLPLLTFYPAIMASAWFGGLGPGLTTTLLSALSAWYFFLPPQWSLRIPGAAEGLTIALFVGVGVFISALTEALHRAEQRQAAALAREQAARAETEHGHEAEARLAAIVQGAEDAIIGKTLDGTITSWNPAAERMFGYSGREAVGRPVTLIVPADRAAEQRELMARLQAGESIEHLETERMHKDGRRIPISLTISPVRDADGRVIGASKIARDITQRREAEAALREADRRKDEFLAILGHELRTPLGAIVSATEILSAAGPSPSLARPVEIIRRQAGQLARLVEDLLDVARFATGKIVLDRAPVDLGAATETCISSLVTVGRLEAHRFDLQTEPAWVDADAARLEQIITNLLMNAIKYTPAGGTIAVRVERAGEEAVLRVKDNGEGISAELLPRVFELFTQGKPVLERRHEGLGIGLALVRRLVELHGGQIYAYSDGVGHGSEFVVRLPRIEPPRPQSASR